MSTLPEPAGPVDTEPYPQGSPWFPNGMHPPPYQGDPHLNAIEHLGQPQPPPRLQSEIHCLAIVGQIEGHLVLPPRNKTTKYEHVMPQLVAIEEHPQVKGLLVLLNTVGGDIEAGLAIAELIRSLSKPTVSLVLGGGHSIGAPIAVAADYSFLAETATVTIHPIRLTGLVIGVPQTYEYLDKMQDRVIRFIVSNSGIAEHRLRELMFRTGELMRDVGTVLVGREAVNVGLMREVGGLSQALRRLHGLVQEWEAAGRRKPPHWLPVGQIMQGAPAPLPPFRPVEPIVTGGWPR